MLQALRHNIITGFLFLYMLPAYAQYKFDKAVVLKKETGFPINNVRCVTKSADGFMWIGNDEGLYRFDGSQVKSFHEGKDLRHSLADNYVAFLLADKDKLWIAGKQGASVLNLKDYCFKHYQFNDKGKRDSFSRRADQNVMIFYRDRQGKIWVGTSNWGVGVYDEAKDDFHFFPVPAAKYPPLIPALGPSSAILNITQSAINDSIIWAGTTGGLIEINKFSGSVELISFQKESKDYQIALNAFRRLYHHEENNLLYVGSWAAGLNVFDPVNKTFVPVEAKSDAGNKMLRSVIAGIRRKSDHEIFVSGFLGLAVYDINLKDITWYKLNKPREEKFYSLDFVDEANRVWLAGEYGLYYYDPAIQQLTSHSLNDFLKEEEGLIFYMSPDKDGNKITICPRFTNGLIVFDKQKQAFTKFAFPRNTTFAMELEAIKGFTQYAPGEFAIASDKGVFLYSLNKQMFKKINNGPPFMPTRRTGAVTDKKGWVWLSDATYGLVKWNPLTGQYKTYKTEKTAGDTSASQKLVSNLFADGNDNIWFSGAGGVGVYVASLDSIIGFSFRKNEKNSFARVDKFAEDKQGRVWALVSDGWLGYAYTQNPEKGIIQKLNFRDKGVQGLMYDITADGKGNIWGYTLSEIVKLNASDFSFTSYSLQYGASDGDFFHFSFLPSGEMIFGGRRNITIANPENLKRNTEKPAPYISEIQVFNQPYAFVDNGQPLSFSYEQNFFSIGFSAKAYTMGKDVKFRYRLKGFDDWGETTARRFANYTNVPGGDYIFQLQAMNNEGVWNDKILELPVHVDTPFWETWWFRLLVIVGIASVVFPLYNYRENTIRKKEQIKAAYEKKIANVEMSSLLAQMNPHFLFNSLNSIDSYIIKNDTRKASEYLNNFARLMRLILQNSRSNYISLKDELEALELYMQMESLRFNDKFEYSITVDENINTAAISMPPMLIQPYVENAIWHGLMHLPDRQASKDDGIKGKVDIIIKIEDYKLKCVVQDNGIGRGKAEEIKSQKTGNHKRSMGMQITKDRIEMINKLYGTDTKVEVKDLYDNNGEATGTRVELIIPV